MVVLFRRSNEGRHDVARKFGVVERYEEVKAVLRIVIYAMSEGRANSLSSRPSAF